MEAKSKEALCYSAALVLLGMLSLYAGVRWFGWLIPAALLVWLAGAIRCRLRDTVLDGRVENRN